MYYARCRSMSLTYLLYVAGGDLHARTYNQQERKIIQMKSTDNVMTKRSAITIYFNIA